ncbi:DUF6364 family protein [Bacteroides sp. GD17]|jgi:hypothetical protein|uniref:DUF6364 family protein n=1 Tax=Bacteroides sp. GD17 TaxID=3139826 RepID=UPI00313BD25C
METRLYLNLNPSLLDAAKKYAKEQGISLSTFFEDMLSKYLPASEVPTKVLPENLRKIKGSLSGIKDVHTQDARLNYLLEKNK